MKTIKFCASFLAFVLLINLMVSTGMGQAINFDLDYSDPASDVRWIYENGTSELKNEPKDVNIKWLRSELEANDGTLKLTIELSSPGQIRTDHATSYLFNIYTTVDNATHFILNYTNGGCSLRTNASANIVNGSVDYTISGQDLVCFVNVSDLGNITYYNVDASAETREYVNATVGWVLKKDFGWEVSGSPGTTPEDEPEDGNGTPGFGLWTMMIATMSAFAIVTFVRKFRDR